MIKKTVRTIIDVVVEVDETKFTPKFMADFREAMYLFHDVEEHIEHLGQMYARDLINDGPDASVEGYGSLRDFGVKLRMSGTYSEVL